jgi:hypothetical protein
MLLFLADTPVLMRGGKGRFRIAGRAEEDGLAFKPLSVSAPLRLCV